MKVVILAGGLGSRLAEETSIRPKPMVEIGGIPIIEHIMNWYMAFGFYDFIICLGYKGSDIISYFKDYNLKNGTCIISADGKIETINKNRKKWKLTLAQTGLHTQTAGRVKKIEKFLDKDEPFMLTYGDGLSNVNILKLLNFHKKHKKLATVTAVRPLARFGAIDIENNHVKSFIEKPKSESGWINGGFFVLEKKVLKYIKDPSEAWETGPLPKLVKENQLLSYKHHGFWQPMDTLREKFILNNLWKEGKAPWIKNNTEIKNIYHITQSNVRQA